MKPSHLPPGSTAKVGARLLTNVFLSCVVMLFLANSYLLGRMYFELAAMRFRPPFEAKAMRRANGAYVFLAGMVIALFVSIPVLNLATPIFAMAFMVHIHKQLSGRRIELIEPAR